MLLAHKIEIRPTKSQEQILFQHCGIRRFTYNKVLNWWSKEYKSGNKPNKRMALDYLKTLKEEFTFLKEVSSRISRNSLDDLEKAFKLFFKKIGKYPRFKKRGLNDSFSIREKEKFKIIGRSLKLEKIKEPFILRNKLRFNGIPKQVTISYKAGKWFASILVEINSYVIPERKPSSVGVDLGLNHLAVLSNGIVIDNSRPLQNKLRKLKKLQRRLSKKVKFSMNWRKLKSKISRLHYFVNCKRKAITNEFTTYLCKNFGKITIEDLNVSGLLKNKKLSKSISDVSWYEIRRQLEYKAKLFNNDLIIVDRFFPSSKLCSSCGTKKENMSLSNRTYKCTNCGLELDRDLNASINLNNYSLDGSWPDTKCL